VFILELINSIFVSRGKALACRVTSAQLSGGSYYNYNCTDEYQHFKQCAYKTAGDCSMSSCNKKVVNNYPAS